jgi:hypothetical protein
MDAVVTLYPLSHIFALAVPSFNNSVSSVLSTPIAKLQSCENVNIDWDSNISIHIIFPCVYNPRVRFR